MVGGPCDHFKLLDNVKNNPLLFIAIGTGIYHISFIESYENLDFQVIHGKCYLNEAYEKEVYADRYFHCVSREKKGDFNGRVTEYNKDISFSPNTNAFCVEIGGHDL